MATGYLVGQGNSQRNYTSAMTIWREIWHRARRSLDAVREPSAKPVVSAAIRGPLQLERLDGFGSRMLEPRRTIEVFFPHEYQPLTDRRYPVLYLNDGQDAESLDLAGTLARMQAGGLVPPLFVVAIHATGDRIREYGTAGVANAQGLGDRAAQYEGFLLEEVMPYIEGHYPVLTGPLAT